MTLTMMTPEAHRRFDQLCKLAKGTDGPGLTLKQIGTAGALARMLQADEPDAEKVRVLAERLGLDPEEVGR